MSKSRRRIFSIATAAAIAASLLSAPQAASATPVCSLSVGAGTSGSPYAVSTRSDLEQIAVCGGVGKYFVQTVDISLSGTPWTPTGAFSGTYDGGGKTISGIDISSGTANIGLISSSASAEFMNLTIAGSINRPLANTVGLLVGYADSTSFHDLVVRASVVGHNSVGSLAGKAVGSSAITRVSSASDITGNDDVGGIVGALGWTPSSISKSTFSGSVTTSGNAGGIAGRSDYGTFADTYSTGTMTISGTGSVGGITGAQVEGSISNSYSTMLIDTTVTGSRGSLVGSAWRVNVSPTQLRSFGLLPMALSGTSVGNPPTSTSQAVTSAALQDAATFSNVSWDIGTSRADNKIWTICSYANGGRPFLTFQSLSCAAPVVPAVVPAPIPQATVTGQSIKLADLRGGETLTIFGGNLADLMELRVDGLKIETFDVTDEQLSFKMPEHSAGVVTILIVTKATHLIFMDAMTYVDKTLTVIKTVTSAVKPVKKPVKKPTKKVAKKK